MKYCTHCGAELLDEAVLCPKCGCWCDKEVSTTTTEVTEIPKLNVRALVGFILALVSVIPYINIFGMISIAGVILSSIGLSQINIDRRYTGKAFAIVGLAVSCAMYVVGLIYWMVLTA